MATALTSLALGSVAKRPREVKPPLVKVRTILREDTPAEFDVEANLDPLELLKAAGVGVLVGGVALAAGWLLWDGLAAPTPFGAVQVFRGVKESAYWRDQAATAQECGRLRGLIRQRRAIIKSDPDAAEQMEKEIAIFEAEKAKLGCFR